MLLHWHQSAHVKPVLGQSAGLVEAEGVQGSAEVDAARTDAENVLAPKSLLCKHDSDRHGGWQRRRNDYCYQVQRTTDYQTRVTAPINLQYKHSINNTIITRMVVNFLSDLGRRITQSTDHHRESAFLFQRLSMLIQRCNAVAVLGTFTHTTPEDEM